MKIGEIMVNGIYTINRNIIEDSNWKGAMILILSEGSITVFHSDPNLIFKYYGIMRTYFLLFYPI